MASTVAKGIMRGEAMDRLNAVAARLLGEHGLKPSDYTPSGNDPELAQIRVIDTLAGDLEQLEAGSAAAAKKERDERASELESVNRRLAEMVGSDPASDEDGEDAAGIEDIHARLDIVEADRAEMEALREEVVRLRAELKAATEPAPEPEPKKGKAKE